MSAEPMINKYIIFKHGKNISIKRKKRFKILLYVIAVWAPVDEYKSFMGSDL